MLTAKLVNWKDRCINIKLCTVEHFIIDDTINAYSNFRYSILNYNTSDANLEFYFILAFFRKDH